MNKEYIDIYDDRKVKNFTTCQLQDYQKMIRNYMNVNTTNDNLFIWHSTGRGKTISALSISEPYSKVLLSNPSLNGYIYIIGTHSALENFINELISPSCNIINNILPDDANIYITTEERVELLELRKSIGENSKNLHIYKQMFKKVIGNRLKLARYRFYSYQKFINLNITSLENSLIIVDEAHNMLNTNEYAHMLRTIIDSTKVLKTVLLSATPMFNSPYDIVDFMNLLFKYEDIIKREEVFESGTEVKLKKNGLAFLQKKCVGKISYLTSHLDENFPTKIEMGEKVPFLKATKLIRVPMSKMQLDAYYKNWQEVMSPEIKNIINAVFPEGFMDVADVTVSFLQLPTLYEYAPKYAKMLENVKENVKVGKVMIYHSHVNNSGIKLIARILSANGFAEYGNFVDCPKFAILHGEIPLETRSNIINIYNSDANLHGELISVLIGAQLLRESVDIKAGLFIHIVNYQENYSRIDQIEGRFIRYRSHEMLPKEMRYVKVYKYVSSLGEGSELSAEELEYVKDEHNHLIIREITASLKLSAIDCVKNAKYNNLDTIECKNSLVNYGLSNIDTYGLFYSETEVYDTILMIFDIFQGVVGISYDILYDKLPFDVNIINTALNQMMLEQIKIPHQNGYLVRRGANVLFQPCIYDTYDIDLNMRRIKTKFESETNLTSLIYKKNIEYESKYKFNVGSVYEYIIRNPNMASIYLLKLNKDEQIAVLEHAIRNYILSKKKILPTDYIILKAFKNYLIDENEMESEINNTPFDKYFNSSIWSEKDDNKKFIGHFIKSSIRVYNEKLDKFEDVVYNFVKKHKSRKLTDNPFGVGFLSRDTVGNIVFKIRDPIHDKVLTDMRKLPRGYVCDRVNNKENLFKIMDNLGMTYNHATKISNLCVEIEKELRSRQKFNNKNDQSVLWFEDIKK